MSVRVELPTTSRSLSSSSSRRVHFSAGQQIMLSDPPASSASATLLRRDGLKLSFNRSISEPHGPNPPILSPPSVSPSLHASKRCRMDPPAPLVASSATATLLRPPPHCIMPPGSVSLPSSPCSESSTLQRTLMLQKARTIEPDQLATKLGCQQRSSIGGSFLLVDCRPFMAYNVNHISGAINVNCCDRFNRKRLQQGKATLADLATTKEGKELLKKRSWKEVVVYDDCSDSLDKLPASHTLFLVMNALVEDHREPVMLLGGLRDFQGSHRAFCEDHLMSAAQLLPCLPSPSDACDTKDIENHPATEVLPFLFLGNMRDASDVSALRRLGVNYVLNVTAKPPDYALDPFVVYKQLEAADNGVQNLRQFFEEAFDFIDLAKANGSGVLIHCHAGVSRSPTIAVAYLMKYYPMAMSEAYKFVKTRRSIISPNLNFMGQLWEFEQGLRAEEDPSACKQPLTSEMRAVLGAPGCGRLNFHGAMEASEVDASKACSSAMNQAFRWSESTAVKQHPKEDGVTSGCSV